MMYIGGLADSTGFSADEILNMSPDDLHFWWNTIMAYRKQVQKHME